MPVLLNICIASREDKMKKSLTFALLLLPLLCLAGPPQPLDHQDLFRFLRQAGAGGNLRGEWVPTEMVGYDYSLNDWEPYTRSEMHYTMGANPFMPDSISVWAMDTGEREWVKESCIELTYNNQGYVASAMMYNYWEGIRTPFIRMNYVYDNQNRLIHGYYDINFDMKSRAWEPYVRYHYSYGAGTLNSMTSWMVDWFSGETEYTHSALTSDAQGRITEDLAQTSADSTNWINDSRTVLSYTSWDTSSGLDLIYYLSRYFPIAMLGYFPSEAMGATQHESYYEWISDAWAETERYDYSYNAQYQCTEELLTVNEGTWVNSSRWLNAYSQEQGGKLGVQIEQEWLGGNWSNYEKTTFDYMWINVAADDPAVPAAEVSLSLYPSPFTDQVSIDLKAADTTPLTVKVYNLKGQILRQWSVSGNRTFVWDGRDAAGASVPSGVYLIKAGDGAGAATRKCLKLK